MTLKTYITRTHIAMDVAIKANSATGAETKAVKVLSQATRRESLSKV